MKYIIGTDLDWFRQINMHNIVYRIHIFIILILKSKELKVIFGWHYVCQVSKPKLFLFDFVFYKISCRILEKLQKNKSYKRGAFLQLKLEMFELWIK